MGPYNLAHTNYKAFRYQDIDFAVLPLGAGVNHIELVLPLKDLYELIYCFSERVK
jgi:hypothetical protein